MKKNELNKFTTVGLIFNGIFLMSNGFNILPDLLNGFCAGLGIFLIFFGIYSANHKDSKLINLKRKLIKKYFK